MMTFSVFAFKQTSDTNLNQSVTVRDRIKAAVLKRVEKKTEATADSEELVCS